MKTETANTFGLATFLISTIVFCQGALGQKMPEKLLISSYIPVVHGADLFQLDDTASLNRNQTRKMYMDELVAATKELAALGGNPVALLRSMAQIQESLDGNRDRNMVVDRLGLGVSLGEMLKSEIEQIYSVYSIDQTDRKIGFVDGFGIATGPKRLVANSYLMMTFTVMAASQYRLDALLGSVATASEKSFSAQGSFQEVMSLLAAKIFVVFQSKLDRTQQNPHPTLRWKAPPVNSEMMSTYEAKRYCQGQGMRLPYADEVLLAQQQSEFRSGGMKNLRAGARIAVENLGRVQDLDYVLVYGRLGEEHPAPTLQPASQGSNSVQVVCVQGAVSSDILATERLFTLSQKYNPGGTNYRFFPGSIASANREIVRAIESLLVKYRALGSLDNENIDSSKVMSQGAAEEILNGLQP